MAKEIRQIILEMKWDRFNQELATELGVSPTSVSLALNGHGTSKRILEAALNKIERKYEEFNDFMQSREQAA